MTPPLSPGLYKSPGQPSSDFKSTQYHVTGMTYCPGKERTIQFSVYRSVGSFTGQQDFTGTLLVLIDRQLTSHHILHIYMCWKTDLRWQTMADEGVVRSVMVTERMVT